MPLFTAAFLKSLFSIYRSIIAEKDYSKKTEII